MEILEVIMNVLPNRSAYEKTLYLLKNYRDMKNGAQISNVPRCMLNLMERALNMIKDDEYIGIIQALYIEGKSTEETETLLKIDRRTLYRQRRRLIKRLAVIIYGDEAL